MRPVRFIRWKPKLWKITVVTISMLIVCRILYLFVIRFKINSEVDRPKNELFGYLKTYLVILITSSYNNTERRQSIRNTWLNGARNNYKFIIGSLSLNDEQKAILLKEQVEYGDIFALENVEDDYKSLTKKVLYSFLLISRHWTFEYLLKCDDDTFVRVVDIEEDLRKQSIPNLYWGFFNGAANVKRTGKWKENNWFLCDFYLPYALGGGYVLSKMLVDLIANNSPYLRLYNMEDVSVGTWLAPFDIIRKHDPRFDTEYRSRGCFNSFLITHKKSPSQMYSLQYTLETTGMLCKSEYKAAFSYMYNWNVPPSKCCTRYNISIP